MSIEAGWFNEKEAFWEGQRFCLKVREKLYETQSEYQNIVVFDSTNNGRVLVLDGVIQLTTKDEFAYQEMITNLPLFAHPNPETVLIVGGGDGGVLREVCRHKSVKEVVMCEIDKGVCDTSKQFFADTMATAFNDPRATVIYMDAAKYIAEQKDKFDVIIVDSSDPVGPAASLYTSDFYLNMAKALKKDGIVCTQGESQWQEHHLDLMRKVIKDAHGVYPVVDYAYVTIPSYPDGQIGFVIATKMSDTTTLRTPKRAVPADMAATLRYYNSEIHSAAFVLPSFSNKVLADVRPAQEKKAPVVPLPVITGVVGAVLGVAAAYFLAKRK